MCLFVWIGVFNVCVGFVCVVLHSIKDVFVLLSSVFEHVCVGMSVYVC